MTKSFTTLVAICAVSPGPLLARPANGAPPASPAVKALVARTFGAGASEITEPETIERGILTIGSLGGGQRRTLTIDFPSGARSFEIQAGRPSWHPLPGLKLATSTDRATAARRALDMSLDVAARALKRAGVHPKDAVLALASLEQARNQARSFKPARTVKGPAGAALSGGKKGKTHGRRRHSSAPPSR